MNAVTDWKAHYRNNHTPWDLGKPHPALVNWLTKVSIDSDPPRPRAFVPGPGRGHDALAIARAGFEVTAVDIVDELHATFGAALEKEGGHFVSGDALSFEAEPFDLVFEHTFYCAISPEERSRWLTMVERLLRRGGRLAMLAFPVDKPLEAGGPPWGIARGEMSRVLARSFDGITQTELPDMTGRRWAEAWVEAVKV